MNLIVEDFPEELVAPIKALTDETRRKIIKSLLEVDSASYSQIQKDFQIVKGTLNHHLHILVSSSLVRNFSIKIPGTPFTSYYAITNFGRKFIEGLRQTLEPKIIERTFFTTNTLVTEKIISGSASTGEEKQPEELPVIETFVRS